jgi:nucleoid DNA-binding protein
MAKSTTKATPSATKKAPTKSEIYAKISEDTGLTKKQIAGVFDSLADACKKNLGSRGPGSFVLPGLCKMTVKKKPATKARPGISPFTKQPIMIKAKPASKVVRIRPLKNLKEMVA